AFSASGRLSVRCATPQSTRCSTRAAGAVMRPTLAGFCVPGSDASPTRTPQWPALSAKIGETITHERGSRMPEGQILEFSGLTKRFGSVTAVEDFSARIEPGVVTGFLGPNGAGKTTTLRILLGLVRASEGRATIGGVPYAELRYPLQTVGAALEASSFHPART